jgi:hypothetical protein
MLLRKIIINKMLLYGLNEYLYNGGYSAWDCQ